MNRVTMLLVIGVGFGGMGTGLGQNIVQSSAVQSSAVQSSAVQSSAVQSSAVPSSAVQSGAVQSSAVQVGAAIVPSRATNPLKPFPKGWLRGFTEFSVAPPHNEPDLNRCLASTGAFGGTAAECSAFARFVGSGYIELQPFGATPLRHVFLFAEPHLFLGSNVPQFRYSFSAAPLALERSMGFGVALPRNFELRLTEHRVEWMGRYQNYLGHADLGKNGPFGSYTTVSARWYFGGYNDRK